MPQHNLMANTATDRQLHTAGYVVADATARAALTGMQEGDLAFQSDTDVYYQYDGSAWEPLGTSGPLAYAGDITPSQITADQNDYNPTGLSAAAVLRLSSDASRNITGLQGGSDGRVLWLYNIGANPIVLIDESGSSSAANRFAFDGNLTLAADTGCQIQYDATSSRWRLSGVGKAAAGALATDTFWDAKGDLAAGTGADAAARLAVGADDTILMADSGQATGLKWVAAGVPAAVTPDAAAAAGTADNYARSDHQHGVVSYASTPTNVDATAGSAGTSGAAPARGDHRHTLGSHGAALHDNITRSFDISMQEATNDGGTLAVVGTVPSAIAGIRLDDGVTDGFYFSRHVPSDAVAGQPLTITIFWVPVATDAGSNAVRWSVEAAAIAAGTDATAAGTTTAFTGSAAARTANITVVETTTQILAAVNAGEMVKVNVRRLGADAADTYVGNLWVIGVRLNYTANQ